MTVLFLALVIINMAAIWGIISARRSAEAIALQDLRFQTTAHARSLEAFLSSRRGDFIFLSQSSPLAGALSSLKSQDPITRKWGRLDIEGSLLLFLAGHPEVERLIIRDSLLQTLLASGRRGGAPALLPARELAEIPLKQEGLLVGSWPLRFSDGTGSLVAVIDISTLLKYAVPGFGPPFFLMHQGSPDAGATGGQSRDLVVVSVPVRDDGWPTPIRWSVVCRQNQSRLVESVTALAARYRTTVILNVLVMGIALVLGIVGFQQVRRSVTLQAENEQQARVRELERQLMHSERLASVGRLAAGMAHEINNPLEGMSNYLALLEEDLRANRTEESAELTARVREGLERAAAIVRQVLTFSDPGVVPHSPVNINEVLDETVRFVRSNPVFRRTRVALSVSETDLRIMGNRVTLGQVFLNLLLNACQIQQEEGTIEVQSFGDNSRAVVLVSDRGPGISSDMLTRIFEPFHSSRGSTGLGLSVCHGIVTEHGGSIGAANREGGGAVFRVELPLACEVEIVRQI